MATLQISFHAFSEMRMCLLAWQFVDEAFNHVFRGSGTGPDGLTNSFTAVFFFTYSSSYLP